jgi:glycosyltransferase involved in cell wall biosynthesis
MIETLALAVVKRFDLVVVRGSKAREFLAAHGIRQSVVTITGSVHCPGRGAAADRDIDLIFVGRLTAVKQVHQFLALVDAVKRVRAGVRAAIVGDGPLKAELQAQAARLGVTDNIEFCGQRKDVGALLARARIFVLTSQSEGLSIAMAEAMALGVVPVVADVGDLGDLVIDGVNGHLVAPGNIGEYGAKVASLLSDGVKWAQYSREAREAARVHCDVDAVSRKWRQHLQEAISRASGRPFQETVI